MPKIYEVFNMKFYVNTKEARTERPHVHVIVGKGRTNDLKIWLDTATVGGVVGEFTERDIRDALKTARTFKVRFIEEYEAIHGKKVARARPRKKRSAAKK